MVACCNWGMSKPPLPSALASEEIGKRLALLRRAHGLDPVDVCRDLEMAPNAYSQWESGKRRVNLEDGIRLAEAFGATLDYIYLGRTDALGYELNSKINIEVAKGLMDLVPKGIR